MTRVLADFQDAQLDFDRPIDVAIIRILEEDGAEPSSAGALDIMSVKDKEDAVQRTLTAD